VLSSTRDVQIRWETFQDAESGIERYEVALVSKTALMTSSVSLSISNFAADSPRWYSAGKSTWMMIPAPSLPWTQFYAVVRGWNRAGLYSESMSREFYMVEDSFEASVFDGDGARDLNFIASSELLFGRAIISNPQRFNGFMRSVECGFGTTALGMQLQHFKAAEIAASSTNNESDVENIICRSDSMKDHDHKLHGLMTHVTVKVTTCWGSEQILGSNGALVDATPPAFQSSNARVLDSTGRQSNHLTNTQNFFLEWNGITDRESGVVDYGIRILSQASNVSFVSTQTSQYLNLTGNTLPSGEYVVQMRATNQAGLVSIYHTMAHFTIDSSPPVAASSIVTHEPGPAEVERCQEGCQSSTTAIRFSWQLCSDHESQVSAYSYAVILEEFKDAGSIAHTWSSVGLSTFAMASGLTLERNSSYLIFVRCKNAAKLFTEM